MRSRKPFSPPVSDRGWAPPTPSSPTSMTHRSSLSSTRTHADVARACSTTLVSGSQQKKPHSPRSRRAASRQARRAGRGSGAGRRGRRWRRQRPAGRGWRGGSPRRSRAGPRARAWRRVGRAEQLLGALRRGRPFLLGELEVDDSGDEPLLGAVVQVAGDPPARGVGGGYQARAGGHQLLLGSLAFGDVADVAGKRRRSQQPSAG